MGLYEFNPKENKFEKSGFFEGYPDLDSKQVFKFRQCSEDVVWFSVNKRLLRAFKSDNAWKFEDGFKLIKTNSAFDSIFVIECTNEGVWFGTSTGLYHLKDADNRPENIFKTNITGIYL